MRISLMILPLLNIWMTDIPSNSDIVFFAFLYLKMLQASITHRFREGMFRQKTSLACMFGFPNEGLKGICPFVFS